VRFGSVAYFGWAGGVEHGGWNAGKSRLTGQALTQRISAEWPGRANDLMVAGQQ
jgi:hypothetical protein